MRAMISSKLVRRLAKLEGKRDRRQPAAYYRSATIVVDFFTGEGHLDMIDHRMGERRESVTFKTVTGPGPQIEDFGHFDAVIYFTIDEWKA